MSGDHIRVGNPHVDIAELKQLDQELQVETKDNTVNGRFVLIIVACLLAKAFCIFGRIVCIVRSSNGMLEKKNQSSLRMIRLLSCQSCHNSRGCQ